MTSKRNESNAFKINGGRGKGKINIELCYAHVSIIYSDCNFYVLQSWTSNYCLKNLKHNV